MGTIASQITSLTIVYSTVYSDADQRKHQSSAWLAIVRGIQRGPVFWRMSGSHCQQNIMTFCKVAQIRNRIAGKFRPIATAILNNIIWWSRVIKMINSQRNLKDDMTPSIVSSLPAEGLAPLGVWTSVVTVITQSEFRIHVYGTHTFNGLTYWHLISCVTHVPWRMSGSLTLGGKGNVPGIPGARTTRNFTYLARGPWPNVLETITLHSTITVTLALQWHYSTYVKYNVIYLESHKTTPFWFG